MRADAFPLRSVVAGAVFGIGLLAAAPGPAAAYEPITFPQVLTCAEAADRPLCLLKLIAQRQPETLSLDAELAERPDLLQAVGLQPRKPPTDADFPAARARMNAALADAGPLQHNAMVALSQAELAAAEALHRHAAGRPPAEILASLATLPLTPFPPDGFVEAFESASPREEAYRILLASLGSLTAPADRGLHDGVVAAWDRDLTAARDDPARIRMLLAVGDLDQAAVVARSARLEGAAATLRATYALAAAGQAEFQRDLDASRDELLAEVTRGFSAEQKAELERALEGEGLEDEDWAQDEGLVEDPAGDVAPTDEDFLAAARAELDEARLELFTAAVKSNRTGLARELADQLLTGEAPPVHATPELVKAATPAVALAWMEQIEAALVPYDPIRDADPPRKGYPGLRTRAQAREEQRGTEFMLDLQGAFAAAADGWRALGRLDRVDALIARWRPQAVAEVAADRAARAKGDVAQTPYAWSLSRVLLELGREDQARDVGVLRASDFLRHDIQQGRGLRKLDTYVATAATEPEGAASLLITCESESLSKNAYADARTCWTRKTALDDTPIRKASSVQGAWRIAAAAARGGDQAVASDMVAKAMDAAKRVPWDHPDLKIGRDASALDMLQVIKSQLRAQGRLPAARENPA